MAHIMSWTHDILGFGGGNVLVNYPGSALRNQSMVFSTQPIINSEIQLSQNRLVYILQGGVAPTCYGLRGVGFSLGRADDGKKVFFFFLLNGRGFYVYLLNFGTFEVHVI